MENLFIAVGVLFLLAGIGWKLGWLSWFGHLPGDLSYHGEHFVFYAPLGSMLLLSVLFSLILWLIQRL